MGSRLDGATERPRAVSEYLVERLIRAGAEKICFVISPGKSDILEYYGGGSLSSATAAFVVQPRPAGLCDAIFSAAPLIPPQEMVVVGLPDTVWFPEDGLCALGDDTLEFLLFPVERPELFDAVVTDSEGRVLEIQVKQQAPKSHWVWGAFKMPGVVFHQLHALWQTRTPRDEYFGTLVNEWLARGGTARGVRAGRAYVDVGTLNGYREAIRLLSSGEHSPTPVAIATSEPAGAAGDLLPILIMTMQTNVHEARQELGERIRALGDWFHNLDLGGVWTAPSHFLGDYPRVKWRHFADAIPADLTGRTVLDIGCNAGFYSLEMKRRGAARVLGIDYDERYLAQARLAAEVSGLEIEFRQLSVYDVAQLGEQFDVVIFMGVFYHLRHPLLALDLIHEHVARDLFVFQSMQRGSGEVVSLAADYPFTETAIFDQPGYPAMHFVERRYSNDPTNWWIPNRAGVEAMLRSSGFQITAHPEEEVFICRKRALTPLEEL